jgi:hypothetical protein
MHILSNLNHLPQQLLWQLQALLSKNEIFSPPTCNCRSAVALRDAEKDNSTPRRETAIASTNQTKRLVYIDAGVNWANTLRLFADVAPELSRRPWEVYGQYIMHSINIRSPLLIFHAAAVTFVKGSRHRRTYSSS